MTLDEAKRALAEEWARAEPEVRELAVELVAETVRIGTRMTEPSESDSIGPLERSAQPSPLDEALSRAAALNDRLTGEIARRERAASLAAKAIEVALRLALAAL